MENACSGALLHDRLTGWGLGPVVSRLPLARSVRGDYVRRSAAERGRRLRRHRTGRPTRGRTAPGREVRRRGAPRAGAERLPGPDDRQERPGAQRRGPTGHDSPSPLRGVSARSARPGPRSGPGTPRLGRGAQRTAPAPAGHHRPQPPGRHSTRAPAHPSRSPRAAPRYAPAPFHPVTVRPPPRPTGTALRGPHRQAGPGRAVRRGSRAAGLSAAYCCGGAPNSPLSAHR